MAAPQPTQVARGPVSRDHRGHGALPLDGRRGGLRACHETTSGQRRMAWEHQIGTRPEGLGGRPWYAALGNMDGSKGVAQSVCIFVSHLHPQKTSAQRTAGGQMAQGRVSASHSPATCKATPTPALQG